MKIQLYVVDAVRIGLLLGAAVAIVACSANGSSASGPVTSAPTLGNVPPAPQVTMDVSPQSALSGDSVMIKWSSTNATACTASGSWNGSKALADQSGLSAGPLTTGMHSY